MKVRIRHSGIWLVLCVLHLPALCFAGPPPVINVQPTNQTVQINDTVTFSVTASSGTLMWYQWFKNGNIMLGSTASSLTLSQVTSSSAGVYSVKVSNISGWVVSSNATLTVVVVPPGITTQPQSQTVTQGRSAAIWVAANGSAPLSYQWAMDGVPLTGATGSNLAFSNAQPSNAGNYKVTVTNSVGSVTSSGVSLTVLPATPPNFDSGAMTPSGFKLHLTVANGFSYVISASTNLQDWTPFRTNYASTNFITVTDSAATNIAQRFYRAAAQIDR